MLFENNSLGIAIQFADCGTSDRLDSLLFGESQARAVVAVRSNNKDSLLTQAEQSGLSAISLGTTNDSGKLTVKVSGAEVLSVEVSSLKNAWESAIPEHMEIA